MKAFKNASGVRIVKEVWFRLPGTGSDRESLLAQSVGNPEESE